MHSSTSSSEQIQARRAVGVLVGLLALLGITLEIMGSFAFPRISRIQRRIDADYRAAVRMRPVAEDGKPTILITGNSLLLAGLDVARLRERIGRSYHVNVFFVESTSNNDWYYGLRRLFREGSCPNTVVLGLSTNSLFMPGVRGEYFAHFLMTPRDAVHIASRLHLDATTASNYFLAGLSGWLGGKSEIRKWLLIRSMPDLDEFGALVRPGPPHLPDALRLESTIQSNLRAIKQVCDAYGSRLIVVVPPTPDTNDPYWIDQAAGAAAGVPVLVPLRPGEMPANDYLDGFHLNPHGALLFTDALAAPILSTLDQLAPARY